MSQASSTLLHLYNNAPMKQLIPLGNRLRNLGIFPYRFHLETLSLEGKTSDFQAESPMSSEKLVKIDVDPGWPQTLQKTTLAFWTVATLILFLRLLEGALVSKLPSKVVLGVAVYPTGLTIALLIGFVNYFQRHELVRCLDSLNETTNLIIEYYHKEKDVVESSLHWFTVKHGQFSIGRDLMIFTTLVTMTPKQFWDAGFPSFPSSLVEEPPQWLLYLSLLSQYAILIYTWGYVFQLISICLAYATILQFSLRVISPKSSDLDREFSAYKTGLGKGSRSVIELAETSIKMYNRLASHMAEINGSYKWQLLFNIGGSSVACCMFAYLPLRHWRHTPVASLLVFGNYFFCLVSIFGMLVPALGGVHEASVIFRQRWCSSLARFAHELQHCIYLCTKVGGMGGSGGGNWRKLKAGEFTTDDAIVDSLQEDWQKVKHLRQKMQSCFPFGFQCGIFFKFKSQTLFTIFSSISTYLIIMMQFDL